MKYTVILEKGDKFGYVAKVPALRGCVSQGRTKADALKNVREAIEAYVEALMADGLPVPVEVGTDVVQLEVAAK
jgi:predicted RNase H-like HicB family nuclease